MISREDWEESVKGIRQDMLNRTKDPITRCEVAAIIDAFADRLYESLDVRAFMKKFK